MFDWNVSWVLYKQDKSLKTLFQLELRMHKLEDYYLSCYFMDGYIQDYDFYTYTNQS